MNKVYRICLQSHLHTRWITVHAPDEETARACTWVRKGWNITKVDGL
jgi:hypothetical protein